MRNRNVQDHFVFDLTTGQRDEMMGRTAPDDPNERIRNAMEIQIPVKTARALVSSPLRDDNPLRVGRYVRVDDVKVGGHLTDTWRLIVCDERTGLVYGAIHEHKHREWLRHGQYNYPWPDQTTITFHEMTPITRTVEVTEWEILP